MKKAKTISKHKMASKESYAVKVMQETMLRGDL
jgi:hypothetical protein